MSSGKLRDRVSFFRRNDTADQYGNPSSGFETAANLVRWCEMMPERGRERLEAGRMESSGFVVIRVRRDTQTVALTPDQKAVLRSEEYQVRYIEPHRNDGFVYMTLERGVAI